MDLLLLDNISYELEKIPTYKEWSEWARQVHEKEIFRLFMMCKECGESFDCQYNLDKHKEIIHV